MKRLGGKRITRIFSLLIIASGCCLVACAGNPPPCPYTGTPEYSPSAGCLVSLGQRVLIVESHSGLMSPPGGKAGEGESAQCAAHRETWEETGLDVRPMRLLRTFDTGFQLYHCEPYTKDPGTLNGRISEVRRALWLPFDEFDQVTWRFQGQGKELLDLIPE